MRYLGGCLFMALLVFMVPARASVAKPTEIKSLALGSGFDPVAGRSLGPCVRGKMAVRSVETAILSGGYIDARDSLVQSLERVGNDDVDLGVFGTSATIAFFSRLSQLVESESVVFHFDSQIGSLYLTPRVSWSDYGQEVIAWRDPLKRQALCGTHFLKQIDLGYRLWLALTVSFGDIATHQRYIERHEESALFGLLRASHESSRDLAAFAKDMTITINAFQEGGDSHRLGILLQGPKYCHADALDACVKEIMDLWAYAKGEFAAQVRPLGGGEVQTFDGPAVLGYVFASYESAGL